MTFSENVNPSSLPETWSQCLCFSRHWAVKLTSPTWLSRGQGTLMTQIIKMLNGKQMARNHKKAYQSKSHLNYQVLLSFLSKLLVTVSNRKPSWPSGLWFDLFDLISDISHHLTIKYFNFAVISILLYWLMPSLAKIISRWKVLLY